MAMQIPQDELKHQLRATYAARGEVGTEYDDYLAEAFAEQVMKHLVAQMEQQRPVRRSSSAQRLALAIVSMVTLMPLSLILLAVVAVAAHASALLAVMGLLVGLGLVCAAIVAVNVAFSRGS